VRECEHLITIGKNVDKECFLKSYISFQGVELDSGKKPATYIYDLPYDKVEEHKGWRTILENDLHLLRALRDITWHERREPKTLMGFNISPWTPPYIIQRKDDRDRLHPFHVRDCQSISYGNLDDKTRFIRVVQPRTKQT